MHVNLLTGLAWLRDLYAHRVANLIDIPQANLRFIAQPCNGQIFAKGAIRQLFTEFLTPACVMLSGIEQERTMFAAMKALVLLFIALKTEGMQCHRPFNGCLHIACCPG